MVKRTLWSNDQLLVVFRLYCTTPFGKLHQHNPEIIDLARLIERTPSAVGMKACNFASLDPVQRARNITGLGNISRADRDVWESFRENPEAVAAQAEAAYERLTGARALGKEGESELPDGPTELIRSARVRRVQSFFRSAVLASYEYRCAITDLAVPDLLNASHIIPWRTDIKRRADPRNGIALNVLCDRAFDRGLMTFDESFRVVVSTRLKIPGSPKYLRRALIDLEGKKLRFPNRFEPDSVALEYHRQHVFV